MKTLVVTLKDLGGLPHGAETQHQVTVSAAYTSEVILTDGTIIPKIAGTPKPLSQNGRATFSVYESDSPEVKADYRGFAVRVTATFTPTRARRSPQHTHRTVKVLTAGSDPVQLGNLPHAQPVAPRWTTVDEILADFTSRIDGLADEVSGTANDDGTLIPFGPGQDYSNGDVTALAFNGARLALDELENRVPSSSWPTGTGSPEGVHAAPVGTVYTDTAATFGAVEWTKMTGTGTTGWRVTKGDTGLVDVTSQITIGGTAPVAGDKVEVQRTPYHVTVQAHLVSRATLTLPLVVTLPGWARPGRVKSISVAQNGSTPNAMLFAGGTASEVGLYGISAGRTTQIDGPVLALSPTATPWRTA